MIRRYLRRLFGKYAELQDLASKSWEIHPEESLVLPKAIYLEGHLDKVESVSPWRNWDAEKALVKGGPTTCPATEAFTVDNVELMGAFIYAGTHKHQASFGKESWFLTERFEYEEIDEANLVTTWGGSNYFGAYFLDDYPLELIPEDPSKSIRMISKPYHHDQEYRRLLGLGNPPIVRSGKIRKLTMYEDPTNSSHKAQRYRQLREHLYEQLKGEKMVEKPVYLKRGSDGEARFIENNQEVETFLEGAGFDIVDLSIPSAEEIARKTLGAKVILSVEGSHLSHIQFSMADDAILIVIQPANRFAMIYKEFTDCLGMKFAFFVADKGSDGRMAINLDELKQLLDVCYKTV
jgi:hypothetical protein